MNKDPAFLFYDGDAARDVSHMNRLERGAYFDIIQLQRKCHGITTAQARKMLGKDFDTCWSALELVLEHKNGQYFIGWLREAITKREEFTENQRNKAINRWKDKKDSHSCHGNATAMPPEDEDGNEERNEEPHANGIEDEDSPKKVVINIKDKILRGEGVLFSEWESMSTELRIMFPFDDPEIFEQRNGMYYLKKEAQ